MAKFRSILISLVLFTVPKLVLCQISSDILPQDTSKSFQIDNIWVKPKPSFEFNALQKASKDTLEIVICSNYVFNPFGDIKGRKDLKSSLLADFVIEKPRKSKENIYRVKFKESKMILFFDFGEEASTDSYIKKGEIYDKEVKFINNIKIGISKPEFFNEFFDQFPKELMDKYDVIIFDACVAGTNHIYKFENNHLSSVIFECKYCVKFDY